MAAVNVVCIATAIFVIVLSSSTDLDDDDVVDDTSFSALDVVEMKTIFVIVVLYC